MVVGRLTAGTIRNVDKLLNSLAPGGRLFAALRPPVPGELGQAVGSFSSMLAGSTYIIYLQI